MIVIIQEEIKILKEQWKLEELIRIAEEYVNNNPYDKDVLLELANACWHLAYYSKVEKYTKMLLDNNDYNKRANSMLIHAYARMGKLADAKELVKSYSNCYNSYEKLMLKNNLYGSNDEKERLVNSLLWSCFHDMLYSLELKADLIYNGLIINDSNLNYDERITLMEKSLLLYKLMYEAEDYNSEAIMVMDIHFVLAVLNLKNHNKVECYKHLDATLKLCKLFETYNDNAMHSSVLVKGQKVNPRSRWSKGAAVSMTEDLEEDFFKEIKNEERFIKIIKAIKEF